MSDEIVVGIVGSTSPRGEALRNFLPRSKALGIRDVKLLDHEDLFGTLTEYDGGVEMIKRLSASAVMECDLVFFCGAANFTRDCLPMLPAGAPVVIDVSGAAGRDIDFNLRSAFLPRAGRWDLPISLPEPPAMGLATIIDACRSAAEIEFVSADCLLPVSELGKAGNEALKKQVEDILNFAAISPDILERQLVFNIHPTIGDPRGDGGTDLERRVEEETRLLLGGPSFPIGVWVARVPMFFGIVLSLLLKFSAPVEKRVLIDALAGSPEISFGFPDSGGGAVASPLEIGTGEFYVVGRLEKIPGAESLFRLWVTFDNISRGCVIDAVRIAETIFQ